MTNDELIERIDRWPRDRTDDMEFELEAAFAELAEATAEGTFPLDVVNAVFRMCEREPLLLDVYFPMDLFLVHNCEKSALHAAAVASLERKPSVAVLSLFDPADESYETGVVAPSICEAVAARFSTVQERELQERIVRWLVTRHQRGTWRGAVPFVERRPIPRDVDWRSFLGRGRDEDAMKATIGELDALLDERFDGTEWKEAGVWYTRGESSECLRLDPDGRVRDALPFGLTPGVTRSAVHERLGVPGSTTDDGERHPILDIELIDDEYTIDGGDVVLTFDKEHWILRGIALWSWSKEDA